MFHEKRLWRIAPVLTAELLAAMLTQQTWTKCSAFRLGNLVFFNDSTGPDGAQEYAVCQESVNEETGGTSYIMIESITFSWCSEEMALKDIKDLQEKGGILSKTVVPRIDKQADHRCTGCM